MRPLSSRDRRALGLGLIMLVPALLYVWGAKPYTAALADARSRLAANRDALARDLALVELAPKSDVFRIALDSVLRQTETRLFDADDDGIAAAELGAYVAELARTNDVWIQAVTARDATVSSRGVRTLAVDIRAESDFQGFVAFLSALEHGDRLTKVSQLSLVPATDTSVSSHALQLRATIEGYAPGEAPSAVPAATVRRRR